MFVFLGLLHAQTVKVSNSQDNPNVFERLKSKVCSFVELIDIGGDLIVDWFRSLKYSLIEHCIFLDIPSLKSKRLLNWKQRNKY